MSETLVLMLGDAPRWMRVSDGAIVARGEGLVQPETTDAQVVAVVPAGDVTLHHAELPDLSEPQARAAARLLVAGQSASPTETLHVAVGRADGDGQRAIVAIESARLAAWLGIAAEHGHDPDAVVAAQMLLARPESGYVKGDPGSGPVVRGHDGGFADDVVLTPLLTGGVVTALDRDTLEAGLIAAVTDPEVDLRQGAFAKRRRWGIDWPLVRRIGWLMLAVIVATLLLQMVEIVRLNRVADRIETASQVAARAALPPGTAPNNPLIQLHERLSGLRGPGGGLLQLAAGVASAANSTPNLELASMVFDGGGTLRVTVRAVTLADLTAFDGRLMAAGLTAAPGQTLVDQGRQVRDYTVSTR